MHSATNVLTLYLLSDFMTNPNGRVLYTGPSLLDGAPIVVVATGFAESSDNIKTGHMIQTWIMRQDVPPHDAFRTEAGASVCGDCIHRRLQTCYVSWWQAPLAVWNCWSTGAGYPPATPDDFNGKVLRLGSCGDPAAVPPWVWLPLLARCREHTGYTHQWRDPRFAWLCGHVQASCDSLQDRADALAAGWQPFTVLPQGAPDPAGAVHCAASTERGNRTNCARCHLCDGSSADVVIWSHGAKSKRYDAHCASQQPIPEQVAV